MIASTFHVWVVSSDGKKRKKFGKGDDPTWSPDGYVIGPFLIQKEVTKSYD